MEKNIRFESRLRLDRIVYRRSRDAEMRGTPDDAAILHEEGLRRFVTDSELLRDGIRYSAMCLHGHHCIVRQKCFGCAVVEMRHEFIERFHADTARIAMLEEQHGARFGLGKQAVQIIEMAKRPEVGVHVSSV